MSLPDDLKNLRESRAAAREDWWVFLFAVLGGVMLADVAYGLAGAIARAL